MRPVIAYAVLRHSARKSKCERVSARPLLQHPAGAPREDRRVDPERPWDRILQLLWELDPSVREIGRPASQRKRRVICSRVPQHGRPGAAVAGRHAGWWGDRAVTGCDHLNRPHRDHLFWPHVARSEVGVHRSFDGGLEPGTHAYEVEGGTVRGDPQSQCRSGQPVHP